MATAKPTENSALPDVPAQLDTLRDMKDGWLDGDGFAPAHPGLDWLADGFVLHYPNDAPRPYIYPTYDGGIQAEWTLGTWEISLNITLSNHLAEWLLIDIDTNTEKERTLNLDNGADWEWFIGELRRIVSLAK